MLFIIFVVVSLDFWEEILFIVEEMYDEFICWYVVCFEKVLVGKRFGWEIVKWIDVFEIFSD